MANEPFATFVWVGLSNCDEHRNRRTGFARKISEVLADYQVLLIDGGQLFHEALCCFQNGAFMAATIMCRASLEAAVYTVLTRTPKSRGPYFSSTIDLATLQDKWGQIADAARKQGFLDQKTEGLVKKVRDRGNFVVHYGQHRDKDSFGLDEEAKNKRPIKMWVTEVEAIEILESAVTVLNSLISKYTSKSTFSES